MKLRVTLSIVIICLFCPLFMYSNNDVFQINSNSVDKNSNENENKVYEVTEIINMPFGSSKITYTVSNKNLINTNDLGPDNVRIIKEKTIHKIKTIHNPSETKTSGKTSNEDFNTKISTIKNTKTITIDLLETYERMVGKGIKSIDIFMKLGDFYFYKNDFVKATKYYEALFKMTNEVNPDYYFRYSNALNNIGKKVLSEELLEKYKTLTAKQ